MHVAGASPPPRAWPWRAGVAASVLAVSLVGFPPRAMGTAACTDFTAAAAADGARLAVESPGFLVIERTDVGSPVAQAAVDSLGLSTAYAAYPDPGEEALSVLPVAGVPQDTYPLVTVSAYPTAPEGRVTTPVVNLAASSGPRASRGVADSGLGTSGIVSSGGLVRALAVTECADSGEVTALGENTVEALSFLEGTLRIGRVHSMAKVVVGADGTPVVESDLEIGQVTIAGQAVALNEEGLSLGGPAGPLPDNPLVDVLADAGIAVEYLASEVQPDGRSVIAPALQIQITRDVTGFAPTVTTLTLGRAFAAAGTGVGAAPPIAAVPPSSGSAAPSGVGSGSLPAISVPSAGTVPLPTSPASGGALPAAVRNASGAAVPASVLPSFSTSGLYAVLVASCAVLLLGGVLFRKLGVRLGWT